jgi:hypothetical protein
VGHGDQRPTRVAKDTADSHILGVDPPRHLQVRQQVRYIAQLGGLVDDCIQLIGVRV